MTAVETKQGLVERAQRLRAERAAAQRKSESVALLTFRLGSEGYAVPAEQVRGVIARQAIVPIPSTPRHLLGVTNFRGEILPVFDLKLLLGLAQEPQEPQYLIIARPGADSAALGADSCPDIIQVLADDIKPPRATVAAAQARYLRGHVLVREGALGVIEVEKVLEC